MKHALKLALVLLTSALFFGTAAHAQKITAGHDKAAPFASYKTYKFANTDGARNTIVNAQIMTAIDRELAARGFTKVEDNPDLLVVYVAASGMNLEVAAVPFYKIVNPGYRGPSPGTSQMWDVVTGTLLIDLKDPKTERAVFRGTAKDTLPRAPSADPVADAKSVSKKVDKVVEKIFKKYPKVR